MFRNLNMSSLETFPKEELEKADVILSSHIVNVIVGTENYQVFYRMSPFNEKAKSILLLHGQSFHSEKWVKIRTIHFFSEKGYNVIAIDLPGFGKSPRPDNPAEPAELMRNLISRLKLNSCFIISPSYSGIYSIPLLQQYPECFDGFIAIAPAFTDSLEHEDYEKIRVPTLIIRGERDTDLGVMAVKNLKQIPTSCVSVIPDAGHACYLNDPDFFHTILYNFLSADKSK